MIRILYYSMLMSIVVFIGGCAQVNKPKEIEPKLLTQAYQKAQGKDKELQKLYINYYTSEPQNIVLNLLELGTHAFQYNYYEDAKWAFDKALVNMEQLYNETNNTKKAKSLWHGEEIKEFKGEPYERSMAYFYRGILYFFDKDYENARACFKSAILQDARAEDEQYQADFASLILLEALSSKFNGDDDLYKEAIREFYSLKPILEADINGSNVFLFMESGYAPIKVLAGKNNEALAFEKDYNSYPNEVILIDEANNSLSSIAVDDIFFQASTRGGRPIDTIIEGKVNFKENTEAVGNTLQATGVAGLYGASVAALNSNNNNVRMAAGTVALVSGGLLAIGSIVNATANLMKANADNRYWDNLPEKIMFIPLNLPIGKHKVTLYPFNISREESFGEKIVEVEVFEDKPTFKYIILNKRNTHNKINYIDVETIVEKYKEDEQKKIEKGEENEKKQINSNNTFLDKLNLNWL